MAAATPEHGEGRTGAATLAAREAGVQVTTTARLHMGFLDLEGGLGRRFGSIGMSLDGPPTVLSLCRAETDHAYGADGARALELLQTLAGGLGLSGGHRLTMRAAMPAHAGLGSGTQLALAVAQALRQLHGLPADLRGDAQRLGRGRRSGVGIALFAQGGLAVDGGPGLDGRMPPLLARLPVPDDWRIVLAQDTARQGLSGQHEVAAFAALPPMLAADPGALCRLVLMQLLPALAEDDLERFGDAVSRMQAILGDHFAAAQGGSRFTSPRVAAAMGSLRARGATGVGQTSWGPTGFAFVRGEAAACRLASEAERQHRGEGLNFEVCRALNRGALVSQEDPH